MNLHRRAIRIVHARLGLVSNNRGAHHALRVLHRPRAPVAPDRLPPRRRPGRGTARAPRRWTREIRIIDTPGLAPAIASSPDRVAGRGRLDGPARPPAPTAATPCSAAWAFVFRYAIHALERHHDTWSFHASADGRRQGRSLGSSPAAPGRAKTVFLLEGLGARLDDLLDARRPTCRLTAGGYEFYKGSLFDNIRLGTLLHDFPAVLERLGRTLPSVEGPWGSKIALDLGHVQTPPPTSCVSPSLRIVNLKVESGRDRAVVTRLDRREKLVKLLFDNATREARRHRPPLRPDAVSRRSTRRR